MSTTEQKQNQEQYLCYDVKGIQQFIFSVPKLTYVVGASLLIAQFDQESKQEDEPGKYEVIFTGGGKGAIWCKNEVAAQELRDKLVQKAHQNGLDLRIGISHDLSEATFHADDLYPYVPQSLDGEPCAVSGLWPVEKNKGETKNGIKGIHPLVAKRYDAVFGNNDQARHNVLNKGVLQAIEKDIPEDMKESGDLEFLTVVRADLEQESMSRKKAMQADQALGNRNRWAILSMDGNDMGCQFRAYNKKNASDNDKKAWMKYMSEKLDYCTRFAFYKGLAQAITAWWEKNNSTITKHNDKIILPFRPLILGGDDILCLCHCSYVMDMAETIIKEFNQLSKDVHVEAKKNEINDLWPGTGGQLTISAGIAYVGVTLPLFLSIPYAEKLLGSAKKKFRDQKKDNTPTPSAIDWESITETMLDTPAARRKRDLTFLDPDLEGCPEICLTMRPFSVPLSNNKQCESNTKQLDNECNLKKPTLDDVKELKNELSDLPRSVRTELMTILTLPWGERIARLTAMAIHDNRILKWLDDGGITDENSLGSCWKLEGNKRYNWFLDALLLLEEDERMEKETI